MALNLKTKAFTNNITMRKRIRPEQSQIGRGPRPTRWQACTTKRTRTKAMVNTNSKRIRTNAMVNTNMKTTKTNMMVNTNTKRTRTRAMVNTKKHDQD